MYVALLRFAELPVSDGGSRVLFVVVVVMLIKVRLCETRVVSILWFSCHVRAAEAFSLHVVDIYTKSTAILSRHMHLQLVIDSRISVKLNGSQTTNHQKLAPQHET